VKIFNVGPHNEMSPFCKATVVKCKQKLGKMRRLMHFFLMTFHAQQLAARARLSLRRHAVKSTRPHKMATATAVDRMASLSPHLYYSSILPKQTSTGCLKKWPLLCFAKISIKFGCTHVYSTKIDMLTSFGV